MLTCALIFIISIDTSVANNAEVIFGPTSPNNWQSWFNTISTQRKKDLQSINYNASIFNVSGLDWTQSTFILPHMHGYDQYFYDINTHSYTFDKWLNDLINRYGGIDAFLFWTTYTTLGADDRNQFDMLLAVPGSLTALQNMVQHFHAKNPSIRITFPYHPWDTGTRPSGQPDYITMATFLNDTGGDGFYGDTMSSVPENFYVYSVNTYNHTISIEPEGGGSLQSMNWDTLGRGYWPVTNYNPSAGKWKFYDGRHMTVLCDNRWTHNHTNDIQNAFFNGLGFETWENIWGCWNEIVPRDGEAVRRTATILRYFGNRNNNAKQFNFTQDRGWKPFIPIIKQNKYWHTIFASQFTVNMNTPNEQILFLIVNRDSKNVDNVLITFNNSFSDSNALYVYDCYHGIELKNVIINEVNISVSIDIEGLGYGALLITHDTRNENKLLDSFLSRMNNLTQIPLNNYRSTWKYLLQKMTPINNTKLYSLPLENMVEIPWSIFKYESIGVEIEGTDQTGVDVEYKWEMHPQKEHIQWMTINKIYMDKYPITCSQYKKYLTASGYKPKDTYNYLKNWNYSNSEYIYRQGYENKPVTYLGINEARSYCNWAGKRLPHSYELAFAGRGNKYTNYPWGNTQNMGKNFPQTQHERTYPGPVDVGTFSPQGDSMFNVSDLIGNVWQYTDEFSDIHTRSVIVRGSANYRPNGSKWYFPTAYALNTHNKYFLMDNSYERCGTFGFRCCADALPLISGKPMFWSGKGRYCIDDTLVSNTTQYNGVLCGRFSPQNGYNNLTNVGGLDWVQFGYNVNDNSKFKTVYKDSKTRYITNISSTSSVKVYTNNLNGFYWNDGEENVEPILSKDNATTNGIFIASESFSFDISGLKSGGKYRLRVYVGVHERRGIFDVNLHIDEQVYSFSDSSIFSNSTGAIKSINVVYEMEIDLSTIVNSKLIQLMIEWMLGNGDGNVTLQAIAIELLNK